MKKIITANIKMIGFILLFCFIFSGCILNEIDSTNIGISNAVNYSNPQRWLSLPVSAAKNIDVFFLYPTTYQRTGTNESYICEIDNAVMMSKANFFLKTQASAFESFANIYAPYYRQVDAAYALSIPAEERDKIINGIPTFDVRTAFEYYIKNFNNNRPFILAGHSQGSNILIHLLSEYMKENKVIYSKMIAAYVIGYSITESYMAQNPHLKFATGPDDTGVIISYNTEAPITYMKNPVILPDAIVINPISWALEETPVSAAENAGSMIPNLLNATITATDVLNYADARIDKARGALICSTINADEQYPGNFLIKMGIYHSLDYTLYYNNIKENAANRAKIYLKTKL